MPSTSAADQTNVIPSKMYTAERLVTASSRPASAGPAKKPTLSIVDDAQFDAASSPGPSARSGISEA